MQNLIWQRLNNNQGRFWKREQERERARERDGLHFSAHSTFDTRVCHAYPKNIVISWNFICRWAPCDRRLHSKRADLQTAFLNKREREEKKNDAPRRKYTNSNPSSATSGTCDPKGASQYQQLLGDQFHLSCHICCTKKNKKTLTLVLKAAAIKLRLECQDFSLRPLWVDENLVR